LCHKHFGRPEAAEGVGREGHHADPIADVETARRPAGAAAITSRTQHPAPIGDASQGLETAEFNWQLSSHYPVLLYRSRDLPLNA